MGIQAVASQLPPSDKHLRARAETTATLANGAIGSIKKIIYELRPALLEDLGLGEAVRYQVHEYEDQYDMKFILSIEPDGLALSDDLSIAAFRIFQEAVTNTIRHASAATVSIDLRKSETGLELKVEDDGIGICEARVAKIGSYGILGMRERAAVFGGTVEISHTSGKGTLVKATFPVSD